MRSLQVGAYENMIHNVTFYYGFAQAHHEKYWDETNLQNTFIPDEKWIADAKAHSNVNDLVPRLEGYALAASEKRTKAAAVTGVEIELEKELISFETKLREGSLFEKEDKSAILSTGLADYLNLGVGDTIVLLGQGYQAVSAAGKYPIVGLVEFGSPILNGRMVFLPLKEAQYLFNAENRLSSLILGIDNVRKNESTIAELREQTDGGLRIMGWKEMTPQLTQIIEMDNAIGMIALTILYLIIGFGIFGTILMMTRERIYEFGVLVSIGMKRWRLMAVMLLESLFISILGVICGIVVAYPVLLYFYFNPINLGNDLAEFGARYDIEPVLHFSLAPEIFWTQGFYVFIIAFIISFYPIYKISGLNVVKALRGTD